MNESNSTSRRYVGDMPRECKVYPRSGALQFRRSPVNGSDSGVVRCCRWQHEFGRVSTVGGDWKDRKVRRSCRTGEVVKGTVGERLTSKVEAQ